MLQKPQTPPPKPSLHLNWEDWLPYLENDDVPEADKQVTIEAVWAIAIAFADLGWNIDPAPDTGGQSFDLTAALCAAVVNSNHTEQEKV